MNLSLILKMSLVWILALLMPLQAFAQSVTAYGVTVSTQGGKTTQISNQNFVVESQVMQVVNGPVCGAFYKGVKQPECGSQPAVFDGAAQGTCPAGSEFDLTRWSCWSCDKSKGFTRSAAAVDSDRACARPATAQEKAKKTEFQKAQQVGERCGPGQFYDTIGGGSCWSCPSGYNVNLLVHVQNADKCTRPAKEEFTRAVEHGKGTGVFATDCAPGQFWDAADGNCHGCPAGYDMVVAHHVHAHDKCVKRTAAENRLATQRPGGKCEEGTFTHTYNFGLANARTVCLKCPNGYDQVVLEAGDSPRKCQTTTDKVFAEATKEAALTCKPGQEFDLIGLTQQDINTRAQFKGQSSKPQPVVSGTCWSCPEGYFRSLAHVKNGDACGSSGIDYYYGTMREPGLFGLDGAAEVLAEILAQDARMPIGKIGMLEQALNKWADAQGKEKATKREAFNRATAMKEEAELLATEPQKSGVAAALVFARLLTALADESKATAAERKLIASFTQYVKMKRTFIAYQVKRQYDIWLDTIRWREKNATGKLILDRATMSAYGRPPSFEQAALLATAGVGALDLGVGTALGAVKIPVPLVGEVASLAIGLATGGYQDYTQGFEKALHASAKTAGEIAFGTALTAAVETLVTAAIAKSLTAGAIAAATAGAGYSSVAVGSAIAAQTALASTGVGVAIGAVLIVASMQLEQLNQFLDAPVKVGELVAKATETQKSDLIRMGKTGGGMSELLTYWTGAAEGESQMTTSLKTAYAGLVQQHAYLKNVSASTTASAGKTWTQLPGAAMDVAASANALWVIGTNQVAGGYGLHRWDGKTFVPASGGAVRIDVNAQGNPWVVNDKDEIFRWTGSTWTLLPGKAKDIGIGANGAAWVIGANKVPGGYGIYRWTGSTWTSVPGGALRIDVDPQGTAWIVNDAGSIFRWNGSTFVVTPGKARDIGIGPEGSVFVAGDNGTIHKWNGSTWIMRDGNLNEISVGPNGVPVGVNASKQIWMGYP